LDVLLIEKSCIPRFGLDRDSNIFGIFFYARPRAKLHPRMVTTHKTKRFAALRTPLSAGISAAPRNRKKLIYRRRELRSILFVHNEASLAATLANECQGHARRATMSTIAI
jgi:hypothetical protein